MSTDFEAKLAALPATPSRRGRRALFSDDELRAMLATQDRRVTAQTIFAAVGRSKNLIAFRQVLQCARKRFNGSAQAPSLPSSEAPADERGEEAEA
jgi:hypothetical protein